MENARNIFWCYKYEAPLFTPAQWTPPAECCMCGENVHDANHAFVSTIGRPPRNISVTAEDGPKTANRT